MIIGHPEEAKYGLTREQMFDAYRIARDKGVRRFGIHTMVASNELDPLYFVETAEILFRMILEVRDRLGIVIEFANLGGGIGIPYRPEQKPVDLEVMSDGIRKLYREIIEANGLGGCDLILRPAGPLPVRMDFWWRRCCISRIPTRNSQVSTPVW